MFYRGCPRTAENFDNTLKAFRYGKPFRPFTVALLDGDKFEVDRPDALVFHDGVGIYVRPGGVPVIFDHEGVSKIIGDLREQEAD